jgi:hypothetical protein
LQYTNLPSALISWQNKYLFRIFPLGLHGSVLPGTLKACSGSLWSKLTSHIGLNQTCTPIPYASMCFSLKCNFMIGKD